MSFATPLALLGLAVLPVLALLYARAQQTRRAAAAAFAAPGLQANVAPARPGWRRHAPVAVLGLALLALVIASARPQTTVAVPVERATIVLVTDVSGSMLAKDVEPNRLEAARSAAREFVEGLPEDVEVGVLAFNQAPTLLQSPTRDRADVARAIDRLEASGGTATGRALQSALRAIQASSPPDQDGERPPAAIVLLSDGESTRGPEPEAVAADAKELGVPISTVALGTDAGTIEVPRPGPAPGNETRRVPPDREAMQATAEASGGEAFATADASELRRVYERLGSRLSTEEQEREVSAAFAGAGLLLLLGGAAMSLGWFGRLV